MTNKINPKSKAYKDGYRYATKLKIGDSIRGGFIDAAKQAGYKENKEHVNFIVAASDYFEQNKIWPQTDGSWTIVGFSALAVDNPVDDSEAC